MKKLSIIAILSLMAAAFAVAAVSCKKETQNTVQNENNASKRFDPSQIGDMAAYLKDFKVKMQSVTRGDDETMGLEEAAWHLSSVANYDYGHANVDFTDMRYDTIYGHVSVNNGQITLSDLNAAYDNMTEEIDDLYQNLDLPGMHTRFVDASIMENGEITMSLITTYFSFDHTWYFPYDFYTDTICSYYFSEDSVYIWNQLGATTLQTIINGLEGHRFAMSPALLDSRTFYVYTRQHQFDHQSYIDPYGSPFINNSRIYAKHDDSYATPALSVDEMCYCLDSYLGLPFEYIQSNYYVNDEYPVDWQVTGWEQLFFGDKFMTFYHKLDVTFGRCVFVQEEPGNQD